MHGAETPLSLHDWHEFYLLIGTAAAALVALLFVGVSIGVDYLTAERTTATRIFISPIVVHFSSVLLISAVALAPEKLPLLTEGVIGLNALIGFIVAGFIVVRVMRTKFQDVVIVDHFGYGIAPMVSYAIIFAAMLTAAYGWQWCSYLLATGVLTLLLVNIRNAWDMILTVVRRTGETHQNN